MTYKYLTCNECPLRVYAEDNVVCETFGNKDSGILIVLPICTQTALNKINAAWNEFRNEYTLIKVSDYKDNMAICAINRCGHVSKSYDKYNPSKHCLPNTINDIMSNMNINKNVIIVGNAVHHLQKGKAIKDLIGTFRGNGYMYSYYTNNITNKDFKNELYTIFEHIFGFNQNKLIYGA